MGIKKLTPTSPARRYQTYLTRDELTVGAVPEKSLLEPKKRISGRNNDGRITVRRRGGGHKRFYRIVDFKRDKEGVPGRVTQIEYDPNRSAHIALITYLDGEKRYIIAPTGIEVGKTIMSGADADILPGNTLPLINIPLGTQIHNIELRPGKGGQMARSAERLRSWSPKKAITRSCACRQAKCDACRWFARRQLARSAISSTKTFRMEKPDGRVGRAFGRTFAAWR